MSEKPAPVAAKPLAFLACAVAVIGVAAIWAGVAALLHGSAAWFAVIAALDAILLLSLANWPRGGSRVAMALGVTLATIGVAQYFVATARIGMVMGLRPFESLPLMSGQLAWLFTQQNTGAFEWVCYALALIVAWWLAR